MTIDASGIRAGIAPAPPGSRIATIDFGSASLTVALLIALPDGSVQVIESHSLPPVSAVDVSEIGLPAVVSAVAAVLGASGIASAGDLHALYLSGYVSHHPLVQQAFRPLCADLRLKEPLPTGMSTQSEQREFIGTFRKYRARLALFGFGFFILAVVFIILSVAVLSSSSNKSSFPSVAIGHSGDFNYGAVDAAAGRLYVGNQADKTVSVVDTVNRVVVATISLPDMPMGIAVDPDLHRMYAVGRGDYDGKRKGTLSIVDTATNAVLKTIETGNESWGVAVDPSTHRVYVTNLYALGYSFDKMKGNPNGQSTLSVIDPQAESVVGSIDIGGNPFTLAIDPVARTAYIAGEYAEPDAPTAKGGVVIVDLDSARVTGYVPVPGGELSYGFDIALDSAVGVVYVTADKKVYVLELSTKTWGTPLGTEYDSPSVAFDAASHTAWVIDSASPANLLAIDSRRRAAIGIVDAHTRHLYGLTVDPHSHTVYAFTSDSVLFIPPPA